MGDFSLNLKGLVQDQLGIQWASYSFSLIELDHLSLLLTESIKIQLPITDYSPWDHAAWQSYISENQKQAGRRREAIIERKKLERKKSRWRKTEGSRTEEHFVSTACLKKINSGQTSLRWSVWFWENGRWFVADKRSSKLRLSLSV